MNIIEKKKVLRRRRNNDSSRAVPPWSRLRWIDTQRSFSTLNHPITYSWSRFQDTFILALQVSRAVAGLTAA